MNALAAQNKQLPDTIEDLSRFVLIGREKMIAVRAEIRAIVKIGLAKEVHEQKLAEAQDLAEAVLDAEAKIGELTAKMEKAKNQYGARDTAVPGTKSQKLENLGITKKQAQRYEALARNPEAVEKAKEKARKDGRVVTRQDVTDEVVKTIPNLRPTPQEFIRQTVEEHREFQEQKKAGIVSMEDARKDKKRESLIASQTWLDISKALRGIGKLMVSLKLNTNDVDLMVRVKGAEETKELINDITIQIKALEFIRARLEGAI